MKKKLLLAALAFIVLTGGYFTYQLFRPAVSNPEGKFFYIREGENVSGIRKRLSDMHLLKNTGGFEMARRILGYSSPRPGRYLLKNGTSAFKLIRMFRNGEQSPVRITIVKERTKELFSGKIGPGKKIDLQFDSIQMIRYLTSNDSLARFGVDTNTAMALVIPDTYLHKWNSTPGKLMQQFFNAYTRFWNDDRKARAAQRGLSPTQVMILASIVDEETNRKADKYNIASVYLNRLKKGMRLQADPTVKFVTRNFRLGRITGSHLKLESPYNTYLNTGLPPGPICTPSAESIQAVLDAPETDYLFFVASYTFDGSSIFTSNLTDHNKYARLFHEEQNRRADSIKKLNTNKP
ncbi:MAG: endolytic transglycosylase MltG [Chitinophagaceae bacterium]